MISLNKLLQNEYFKRIVHPISKDVAELPLNILDLFGLFYLMYSKLVFISAVHAFFAFFSGSDWEGFFIDSFELKTSYILMVINFGLMIFVFFSAKQIFFKYVARVLPYLDIVLFAFTSIITICSKAFGFSSLKMSVLIFLTYITVYSLGTFFTIRLVNQNDWKR